MFIHVLSFILSFIKYDRVIAFLVIARSEDCCARVSSLGVVHAIRE